MKKFVFILFIISQVANAQEALHNYGNLKIHDNGAIGFHHNLINDGITDDNKGLAGFFSNDRLAISGAFRPIFNDMEVLIEENLVLEIGIGVKNHLNFIDGTILTPRTLTDINVDFIDEAFYSGEDNDAKINGYSMVTGKQKFRFPIGGEDRIRPLLLETETGTIIAKSAYFLENPTHPSTFIESFNTASTAENVSSVSTVEFWHLDAEATIRVELFWDDRSNIKNLVETIDNLSIAGWHKQDKRWNDLGVSAKKGDFNSGRIVSGFFNTSDYSILTFCGNLGNSDVSITNYLITPNNDGINDFFILEATEQSPNNQLKIFNRWGRAVFIEDNYTNSFNGKANTGLVVGENNLLPTGLYFYTIELKDIDVIHQGYLYINE